MKRLVLGSALIAAVIPAAVFVAPAAIAAERRDPFVTFLMEETPDEQARTPLESVKLEELTLSGVVVGTSTPKALFQTPDGRGHIARVGDGVGTNRARIAKITRDGVVLIDEWRDAIGRLHKNTIALPSPAVRQRG